MRVLVAGREGQLARALRVALPSAGHEVTALGRPELDITDRASIARAMAIVPCVVVNAAAYTAVDRAEDEPAIAQAINATGAGWLAEAAAAHGARFIHLSTDYVFDGTKGAPYVEDDAPKPLGVYGATKLAGERAVLAANPRSMIIRTAWVCSPHGANFLKTMVRLLQERDAIRVVADQHGAPSFADDLAVAITHLIARNDAQGVFHLTGKPHTTWHGFASAILDGIARRGHKRPVLTAIATADYPTRARRPANARLDCQKITRTFGIVPADWHASLARCLDTLIGPIKEDHA